jgi:hypothetical protein
MFGRGNKCSENFLGKENVRRRYQLEDLDVDRRIKFEEMFVE